MTTAPPGTPRGWDSRRTAKAQRLQAGSAHSDGKVVKPGRLKDLLHDVIRSGDRVALEGDNQKHPTPTVGRAHGHRDLTTGHRSCGCHPTGNPPFECHGQIADPYRVAAPSAELRFSVELRGLENLAKFEEIAI
jgi:hypothetical protein